MLKLQKGFTLIELMIVIAIIAILVALAVPAYQDYTIRTKVGECINGAAPAKLAVSEYFQTNANYASQANEYGVDTTVTSQYCDALSVGASTGIITITSNANTGSDSPPSATLNPTSSNGGAYDPTSEVGPINWDCNLAGGTSRHLPSTCRDSA